MTRRHKNQTSRPPLNGAKVNEYLLHQLTRKQTYTSIFLFFLSPSLFLLWWFSLVCFFIFISIFNCILRFPFVLFITSPWSSVLSLFSLSLCLSVSFTFDSIWFVGRFGRVVPLAIGYQIGNFFPSPLELKSGRCCFNWMMIVYMSQIHFSFSPSLSLSPSLSPYLFSSSSGLSLFGVNVFVVTAASDLFAVALFEYGKCFTALVECISARPFPREPCWGKYKRGLKEEKNLYLRAPTQTHRVRYRVI